MTGMIELEAVDGHRLDAYRWSNRSLTVGAGFVLDAAMASPENASRNSSGIIRPMFSSSDRRI